MITLERFAYSPMGTFGRLTLPHDFECFTVELPWQDNRAGESCIPEGRYPLRLRTSPVVQRSSGGEFSVGWEVAEVPGRTFVMVHPGNTTADLQGCIAPGEGLGWIEGRWAVTKSRDTFRALMAALAASPTWNIEIRSIRAGKLPAPPERAFS